MRYDKTAPRVRNAWLLAAALGCASPAWAVHWPGLHWPWKHQAAAGPQPVQEVSIKLQTPSAAIQQYWDRSTLLLDLTGLHGTGSATLSPHDPGAWPVRLEFRVRPGTIARLEVSAAQRLLFTVPAQGDALVLKLDPGVYRADSAQINLHWSATADLPR